MSEIPTIKVKRDGPKGYRIINLSSFDPAIHEPFTPVMSAAGSASWPSDTEMRVAIKAATGKSPGPRTSREALIEQFNAIPKGDV